MNENTNEFTRDNPIKQTKDYMLFIDNLVLNDDTSLRGYVIENKVTGVRESETFVLPQALNVLEQLQKSLSSMVESEVSVVIPFPKEKTVN